MFSKFYLALSICLLLLGGLLHSRVLSLLPPSRFGDSSTEVKIVLNYSALVLLALLYKVAFPECSQTKRIIITSYTVGTVLAFIAFIKAAVCRRWRNLQKVVMTPHYQAKFGASMAEIQPQ